VAAHSPVKPGQGDDYLIFVIKKGPLQKQEAVSLKVKQKTIS
jgi:hypothetical protein